MKTLLLAVAAICLVGALQAAPEVQKQGPDLVVTGTAYRATFTPGTGDLVLALKQGRDEWRPLTASRAGLDFVATNGADYLAANTGRATWAMRQTADYVAIGRQMVLDPLRQMILQVECLCGDDGLLLGSRVVAAAGVKVEGNLWTPPRILLKPEDWDGYAFWGPDGKYHGGKLADLQPFPAYAGISPWGDTGDTVKALDPQHPALLARSEASGRGLGVVFADYAKQWQGTSTFLQRHTPAALFFYSGMAPLPHEGLRWAWLATFPEASADAQAARVQRLVQLAQTWTANYAPVAPPVPTSLLQPQPDFPASLRRAKPVTDINDAIVYTMNETTNSEYGVNLARKVGSDVLVRGWFKWGQRPPVEKWQGVVPQIHEQGALFGGGITCSALYDTENGITREQLLDMATRDPDGNLVDAWDQPGTRHGSLSSPAYLDYLFRWCKEQIDAGVDYLFMDEHKAALSSREGFDDHSLRDFRQYLREACPQTQGWTPTDPRWTSVLGVPLNDRTVCPDGSMATFDYRAFLRAKGFLQNWMSPENKLASLWGMFRNWRDDRAWKSLTDRLRAYARQQGKTVLISANGIAPYVDLQVLGVWGNWRLRDGHLDLSDNQLPDWRGLVEQGSDVAGKRVPVVLFHDWGFGDTPFPWMAVSPADREAWMRTRGAEIYAAGGFFAFPVLGPFGNDAARDGTLPLVATLSAYYRSHRDLYLKGEWLGCERVQSSTEPLSVASWWLPDTKQVAVHVINRDYRDGALQPRPNVVLRVPLAVAPQKITLLSPDQPGEQTATCRRVGDGLEVTLPRLEAYTVALLSFASTVDLAPLRDPVYARPGGGWWRPGRSEFKVGGGGHVVGARDLVLYLQGMLHQELRNPPTFAYKATGPAQFACHVRGVAAAGARIELRLDGQTIKTVELPDRDGKNDGNAKEYDETYTLALPAGAHRLTVDNVGSDWAVVEWYQFTGQFEE